jgi:hypothetical protein
LGLTQLGDEFSALRCGRYETSAPTPIIAHKLGEAENAKCIHRSAHAWAVVAKPLAGFALVDWFGLCGKEKQSLKMANGNGEVVDLGDRMEGLHERPYFHCILVIISFDVVQDRM